MRTNRIFNRYRFNMCGQKLSRQILLTSSNCRVFLQSEHLPIGWTKEKINLQATAFSPLFDLDVEFTCLENVDQKLFFFTLSIILVAGFDQPPLCLDCRSPHQ